jgi:hypothetical protein
MTNENQDQKTGYVIIIKDKKGNIDFLLQPSAPNTADYDYHLNRIRKGGESIIFSQYGISYAQSTIIINSGIYGKPYKEIHEKINSLISKIDETPIKSSDPEAPTTLTDYIKNSGQFRETKTPLERARGKLEELLTQAKKDERFERAAIIRDRIKSINEKIK